MPTRYRGLKEWDHRPCSSVTCSSACRRGCVRLRTLNGTTRLNTAPRAVVPASADTTKAAGQCGEIDRLTSRLRQLLTKVIAQSALHSLPSLDPFQFRFDRRWRIDAETLSAFQLLDDHFSERCIFRLGPGLSPLCGHALIDLLGSLTIGCQDCSRHGLMLRPAIGSIDLLLPESNPLPRALAVLAVGIPSVLAIAFAFFLLRCFPGHVGDLEEMSRRMTRTQVSEDTLTPKSRDDRSGAPDYDPRAPSRNFRDVCITYCSAHPYPIAR